MASSLPMNELSKAYGEVTSDELEGCRPEIVCADTDARLEELTKIVQDLSMVVKKYFDYQELGDEHNKSERVEQKLHADKSEVVSRQLRVLRALRGEGSSKYSLLHKCVAEFVGMFFITIFGVGVVCTAVLSGAQVGLWQVAVVWGFGVALSIFATASISGAHLNPAVSFAFALLRPELFSWAHLLPYCAAQLWGGVIGGFVNFAIFGSWFEYSELRKGIVRGATNSTLTAMAFGEYFPNPDVGLPASVISPGHAFLVEAWGTAVLMFFILALTDPRNNMLVQKDMAPFFIGFTVSCLISLYAPLTQAGWNPARDLGPRIAAAILGWGDTAIPGPRGGFWVYIMGPLFGAPLGGAFYDFVLARGLSKA